MHQDASKTNATCEGKFGALNYDATRATRILCLIHEKVTLHRHFRGNQCEAGGARSSAQSRHPCFPYN